jgi:cytochrome c556
VDGGADPKTQVFAARGLVRWANTLPTMFPEGSRVGNTRARPEIWSNRPDFDAKAAAYATAAQQLVDAAQTGDKAAFTTQWTGLRETCNACHTPYRAEPPRPAG